MEQEIVLTYLPTAALDNVYNSAATILFHLRAIGEGPEYEAARSSRLVMELNLLQGAIFEELRRRYGFNI